MYRLTSPDKLTIKPHVCNTPELAEIVRNYIESRHDCTIIVEERPGKMYFDCPGSKWINPSLYDVTVGIIETKVDEAGMLAWNIEIMEHDFLRGFSRMKSFLENICLSELELIECKEFVRANQDQLNKWRKEVDVIFYNQKSKEK
jgi:hypothetical protein